MTHVAVVGATGAVGVEIMRVLEMRRFAVGKLTLLASARSAGRTLPFRGSEEAVAELREDSFAGVDVAFFSAGGGISQKFVPLAVAAGAVVVDNSSAFRMDEGTPLVIPEINPEDIRTHKGRIANPNCSTIIMLMACYPIHRLHGIRKAVVSTYQAASGAGAAAMEELRTQARGVLDGRAAEPKVFPYPIAFNAFSHNSAMDVTSGLNQEETKMVQETHKILHDDSMAISPTCIRIGTFRAHAESVHLELKENADMNGIRAALENFPGVRILDDRVRNRFPMPLDATGQDDVFVGRLRVDPDDPRAISLFCCGDQILKGAALNAVQIAERL